MLGQRLKELRCSKNIKQSDLAKMLHVGTSTISGWEIGNYYPDYDKLIWLCHFYNVSSDYLIGLTDDMLDSSNKKILDYYYRLSEENQDYIRGEMVKLYREQENDAVENTSEKKIG